jgi:hypothetical protein
LVGNFEAGKTYWFVLAPVTLNGISITVHDSEENIYVKSRSGQIQLNQGTYRSLGTLNFDKMRPITVSSEHTYGESEMLTGTKLNMSLPQDLTTVSLSVKNSDGNEVRKIDDLSSYSNGVIINKKTKDTDWLYLPEGDYTVSGSYTSSAGGVIEIFDYPFKISKPSARTITYFEPYTSYTNRDNGLDGSTIYIKFKVNVSDEILKNPAYTSLFKFELNGSATSTVSLGSGVLESTLANQAWKAHTITSVKCSFDDSPANDHNPKSTVHVTGIPYNYSFDGGNYSGWTLNGGAYVDRPYGYSSKAVILQYREYAKGGFLVSAKDKYMKGFIVSPKFYIPSNMYVVATVGRRAVHSNDQAINVYAGPVSNNNSTCASPVSASTAAGSSVPSVQTGDLPSFMMSPSSQYVSLDCQSRKENVSRDIFSLHSIKIKYAK